MDSFVNDFLVKISDKVSSEDLQIVSQQLLMFISNYDIQKKETAVVPYTGYLPDFYETYFVTQKIEGKSMKTLYLYNLVLKSFFETVNKEANQINANDIRLYLYKLQEVRKISNRTLDSRRTIIHAFFEWAANEGYIGSNPCRNIKPIKFTEKPRKALTNYQLEVIRNSCSTLRDKAIVETLFSTGCRVSELASMNISDINFETKEVCILGKGSKYRTSYLNARAELYIKEYLKIRDDKCEALFVSERCPHERLTKAAIEKRVKIIGEKSNTGVNLIPHLMRHTNATMAIEHGMPIEEVQKMLGHSNISTTMIYAHVSQESLKNDHKKYVY